MNVDDDDDDDEDDDVDDGIVVSSRPCDIILLNGAVK